MLGLAFGQGDFAFDFAALPMQIQGHQGVAFLHDFAHKSANLIFFKQQLLGPGRIRVHMGRGGAGGIDLTTNHIQLPLTNHHIAIGQLHFALARGLDLPALEHHACFKALFKKIIESCFFVVSNA